MANKVHLMLSDATCDHHVDDDCDCASFPSAALLVSGIGGYGHGEWVGGEKEPEFLLRTLWGDFTAPDPYEAGGVLEERLKIIDPTVEVWVH